MCPELTDAIKIFDKLTYSRSYGEVFYDCVDWMVWEHLFPHKEDNPLDKYQEKEKQAFKEIFFNVKTEVKKRVGIWTGVYDGGWYDPLGRMYECITSKNKSSQMGQYFTPEPAVEMMTKMIGVGSSGKAIETISDPACGSGRTGLAAASRAFANKKGVGYP